MSSTSTDWAKFLTGQIHQDSSREVLIATSYGNSAGKLWGPLNGEPVIALHGWQDCCTSFDRLIPLLPKNYLVFAMDLLGHGHSDHQQTKHMYNSVSYMLWLKEVLDLLRWDKVILLAHSVSVSIFTPFVTILQPHRVKKVIMLDAAYSIILKRFETVPNFLELMDMYEKQESSKSIKPVDRNQAIGRVMEMRPDLDIASAEHLMTRATKLLPDGRVVFTRDPRLNLFILMAFRFNSFGSLEEMYKRFKGEWLMVLAEESMYLPYLEEDKLVRAKKALGENSARFECFTTPGGHYVHLTHPQRIAAKITEFLEAGNTTNSHL